MPVTTYSDQSSSTSGTSTNKTFGDKYAKQLLGLTFAAGGLDIKKAKLQSRYDKAAAKGASEKKLSKLQGKIDTYGGDYYQNALAGMDPVEYYPEPTVVPHDPYTVASIQERASQALGGQDVAAARSDLDRSRQLAAAGPSYAAQASQDAAGVAPWQGRIGEAMSQAQGAAGQAQGYLGNVLGGQYLNANPALDAAYQKGAQGLTTNYLDTVLPALEGRFAHAGGMGGAQQYMYDQAMQGLGGALGDMGTEMYYQNYSDERDRMTRGATDMLGASGAYTAAGGLGQQAGELGLGAGALRLGAGGLGLDASRLGLETAMAAPTVQQMGFYGMDELERAGRTQEELQQAQLQEAMDRYYFGQDKDFLALDRILNRGQQVPLAAGSGTTTYDQRTVGEGSQQAPSPPGQMPMWAQFIGSIL